MNQGDSIGLIHGDLTDQIIAAAIKVHESLGPGLLESAYEVCLAHELVRRGLGVVRQVEVPIEFDGIRLECGYRIDLLIDDAVVVELKSVDKVDRIHEAQLLTYLKLSRKSVGLLLNFNVHRLRDGITRRVLYPLFFPLFISPLLLRASP